MTELKYYPQDCYIWKSLVRAYLLFQKKISWNVGSGEKFSYGKTTG